MFEVILAPDASAFYADCDRKLAKQLARCFRHLESQPRTGNNIKRLKGDWAGYSRFRIGEWRVIYRIDDSHRKVLVVDIAHRREIYE